jgi:carbamoyl-phosphate synthase large subunit
MLPFPSGDVFLNVLISSAGRRASLLRIFQKETAGRGSVTFAGDMDPLAPALQLADRSIVLPPLNDQGYVDNLLSIVSREAIRLLVPTIDTELRLLAEHAERFREIGCTPLISSLGLVDIAGDKWLGMNRFAELGIATPRSWRPSELEGVSLPDRLFIKPRDGSSSVDAIAVDRDDLIARLAFVQNPIVQEFVDGPEITIDALIDFSGEPIHYVPRLRLRTLGGESIQGVTISDQDIRDWVLELLRVVAELGGRGAMTLQAFLTPDGPVFSEVNPRFGGGFPLAHAAGGHYPQWIMQMLDGEKLAPRIGDYEVGLHMTRYYDEEFVRDASSAPARLPKSPTSA